ncbi:hypothetical protein QNA08_18480 [Chelatococcus sp. SYSU_G07232]|uniref:AsnC family transcriptional regulator n=2 Tax=Chelatococcus albus TaxID=3047466 RepID=A0ABT7ALF2_9HYPH|nr:hypothetical protein [Chelatococcus sp. SYSU_G07232]MDJ1160204.1 hypothetical protein [Chelatococcus sp. SYSU_G07232]
MLTIECGANAALDAVRAKVATTSGVASAVTYVVLRTHVDTAGAAS